MCDVKNPVRDGLYLFIATTFFLLGMFVGGGFMMNACVEKIEEVKNVR